MSDTGIPEWAYVLVGSALGGALGFRLSRGDEVVARTLYTVGGVLAGFLGGDALYGVVNNSGGGGEIRKYLTMFVKQPFSSLTAIAGVTGLVFIVIQVFGGEIVDLIPGVDLLALPVELGAGAVVAVVALPVTEPVVHKMFDVFKLL